MLSTPRLDAGMLTSTTDWYAASSAGVLGIRSGVIVVVTTPTEASAASRLAASPVDCSTSRTCGAPTTCTSASPMLFSAYVSSTGSMVTRTEWKPVVGGLTTWAMLVSPAARSTGAV